MLEQLLRDNPSITFAAAVRIAQDDRSEEETMEICERALSRWMAMTKAEQLHFKKGRATIRNAKRLFR